MLPNSITIFTDGSSRGNPGPGGYAAIIIFPQNNDGELKVISEKFQVKELGGREEHTTNNRMELTAAIKALRQIHDSRFRIQVFSDSSYVINGITQWVHGWQKNGWQTATKKEVENRDLWEKLFLLTKAKKIIWQQVGGHIGLAGNERCDEIAQAYADWTRNKRGTNAEPIKLYIGSMSDYQIKNILNLYDISYKKQKVKTVSRARQKAKAYSYVSMVNGSVETHRTWAECEARVKGKRGAKYKKVFSADEERNLIAEWEKEKAGEC